MRRARLLLLPVLGLVCLIVLAQPARAVEPAAPTQIRLGHSFVALDGPWKFTPGDSPQLNGRLLWASPAFDDAAWSNMDLHATPGETDPAYGNGGYVTGWTARGFPNLAGFAWYRIRIHLADLPEPLWLKMPDHNDDSYQVFANGRYLGEFGHFTARGVDNYRSRPFMFQLPAPDEHGDILLAIRFYMEPFVILIGSTPDSGGMHQAPLVGLHSQIESIFAREITGRILSVIASIFVAFFMLIAAVGTFWIWLLDRPRPTYLWLTLAFVFTAVPIAVLLAAFFSYAFTQGVAIVLIQTLDVLGLVCWVQFWRRWFQLVRSRWLDLLLSVLALVVVLIEIFTTFSHPSAPIILFVREIGAGCKAALGVMLFVALFQGARKDRIGALVALPPIVLLAISLFSVELIAWFRVRTSFFPFGIQIAVKDAAMILLVLVVGVLVARRFVGSQVSERLERLTIDQELEQARELQLRVLVPEPVPSALFTVETAYHPARTVGGDFFQIIPNFDGSLLIVVGDVSGKGMAAAMLVAVLVGAARTRADETFDPAAILRTLNERLLGRAVDHFATCIVAHLRRDGTMLLANAGHLPPYRNGITLHLPGSIPLGILADTRYDVQAIQLDPGDHITFVTDGVLEARNSAGQLLGFERLEQLSSLPPDAIAQAAIDHGQDDDITIVGVRLSAPA